MPVELSELFIKVKAGWQPGQATRASRGPEVAYSHHEQLSTPHMSHDFSLVDALVDLEEVAYILPLARSVCV
jgi:hypothetical protein